MVAYFAMFFNCWLLWDNVQHHDMLGVIICLSSVAIWKVADNAQTKGDFSTYVVVHSLWHVSSSLGAFLIAL